MLRFNRKQQNSVKQLFFNNNNKIFLKRYSFPNSVTQRFYSFQMLAQLKAALDRCQELSGESGSGVGWQSFSSTAA